MPARSQLVRGLIGSMLIGAGIAMMISAARCTDCDKGEGALDDIAAASAEMTAAAGAPTDAGIDD